MSKIGVAVTDELATTLALGWEAAWTPGFAAGTTTLPATPLVAPAASAVDEPLLPAVLVVPVAAPFTPLVPGLLEFVLLMTSLSVVENDAVAEFPADEPLLPLEAVAAAVLAGLVGVFAVEERVEGASVPLELAADAPATGVEEADEQLLPLVPVHPPTVVFGVVVLEAEAVAGLAPAGATVNVWAYAGIAANASATEAARQAG